VNELHDKGGAYAIRAGRCHVAMKVETVLTGAWTGEARPGVNDIGVAEPGGGEMRNRGYTQNAKGQTDLGNRRRQLLRGKGRTGVIRHPQRLTILGGKTGPESDRESEGYREMWKHFENTKEVMQE